MKPVRVVLADDHTLVRSGIRSLLEKMPGVEVIGESGDGIEALALAEELDADLLLFDISIPGLTGLEAAARLTATSSRRKVIILSMHANEEYVIEALRAGAAGYLLKDSATDDLEHAIDAVAHGGTYLSSSISRTVIDGYLSRFAPGVALNAVLTPRQVEVLRMVAEGKTTKEIARDLNLSVKTIETHRMQLMERLDIHDVAGLVKYAIRTGLIAAEYRRS